MSVWKIQSRRREGGMEGGFKKWCRVLKLEFTYSWNDKSRSLAFPLNFFCDRKILSRSRNDPISKNGILEIRNFVREKRNR